MKNTIKKNQINVEYKWKIDCLFSKKNYKHEQIQMTVIQKQAKKNVTAAAIIEKKMVDWIKNEKIIHCCFTC